MYFCKNCKIYFKTDRRYCPVCWDFLEFDKKKTARKLEKEGYIREPKRGEKFRTVTLENGDGNVNAPDNSGATAGYNVAKTDTPIQDSAENGNRTTDGKISADVKNQRGKKPVWTVFDGIKRSFQSIFSGRHQSESRRTTRNETRRTTRNESRRTTQNETQGNFRNKSQRASRKESRSQSRSKLAGETVRRTRRRPDFSGIGNFLSRIFGSMRYWEWGFILRIVSYIVITAAIISVIVFIWMNRYAILEGIIWTFAILFLIAFLWRLILRIFRGYW